jgi:hypothetical protein
LIISYGVRNGGIASVVDYNIATGVLALGAIISAGQKQWIIVTIALMGLFFTGAGEALIAVIFVFVALLIQRDWSKKLILPIALLCVIAGVGIYPFDYTRLIWMHQAEKINVASNDADFTNKADSVLNGRVSLVDSGLKEIHPFGEGFKLYPDLKSDHQIHNVPLVIVQQAGPIAAAAWVFVTIYCFIRSRWKYPFITLFALCLFDFYTWDKIGSWWWALIGLSTVYRDDPGLIFKEVSFESNQS